MTTRVCNICKVEKDFTYVHLNTQGRRTYKNTHDGSIWHGKRCGVCFTEFVRLHPGQRSSGGVANCLNCSKEFIQKTKRHLRCCRTTTIGPKHTKSNNNLTHREKRRIYENNKRKTDINYRLSCSLRSRLSISLKRFIHEKMGSAINDLGCSLDDFKLHIQSKFQAGMTWDNYGKWEIDHIYPLSRVDLTIQEELKRVCHFSNLQPLWASDNRKKLNKILEPGGSQILLGEGDT